MLCMEHRYWQMEQLDDSLKVKLDVPPCNEFLYIPIDIDDSIVDESVAMDAFTDDSFWLLPALLAPPSVSSADNFVLDCGAVGMQHFVDKIEAMNGESFHRDTANASCYSLDENSIITNDVSYAARILEFTSVSARSILNRGALCSHHLLTLCEGYCSNTVAHIQ